MITFKGQLGPMAIAHTDIHGIAKGRDTFQKGALAEGKNSVYY